MEAGVYFKEKIRQDMMSEGAIQRAILEIIHALTHPGSEESWYLDGRVNSLNISGHEVEVIVEPESAKVDLSKSPDVILRGLLAELETSIDEQDVIIDSIYDWQDSDNLHRLNGAEDDYYLSLVRPYRCKNKELDSIEELLLIRGVTEDVYYGEGARRGLRDFVTVLSGSGKININNAEREVLKAIPGITSDVADAIINFRKSASFKTIAELRAIVGGTFGAMSSYITVSEPSTYRITAKKEGRSYGVQAVVKFSAQEFNILSWKKSVKMEKSRDAEV
jgi:general secretion pathway protein K